MLNLIVDANSIISRAYFAWKKQYEQNGQGNFFIFVNMISEVASETRCNNIYFMFDSPVNFRRDKFVDYKGDREPDPLRQKFIAKMRYCLEQAGFSCLEISGYEADDLVASAVKPGDYVLSGDKDLLQLAGTATVILLQRSFRQRTYYTPEVVYKKYGVYPNQWVDYRAFVGDPSDGLPGIKGIGPKGAVNILSEWGSLEEAYANIGELPEPVAKKLKAGFEIGKITKSLSELKCDLNLNLKPSNGQIFKVVPIIKKEFNVN